MNPSPPLEEIREFVIAGHGDLEKVKQMLEMQPALLGMSYEWGPGDTETALQAAAHVGSQDVGLYLLGKGDPLDICTAAMLGLKEDVERFLQEDEGNIHATGAHGIPLLTHAALSGNVELVQLLVEHGAREGISSALINAVSSGHVEVARWLLENGEPDVSSKNFQGKTALEIAVERDDEKIAGLLRAYDATR
jgi:ankyrin repeat protein